MSTQSTMRLATSGEPGANVYNMYHFLSQIGALYSRASELEHRDNVCDAWKTLTDSLLGSIEEVFSLWSTHQIEVENPANHPSLGPRISSTCRRAEAIVARMDVWDPASRWVLCMKRMEGRLQYLISKFSLADSSHREVYSTLAAAADSRLAELKKLEEFLVRESELMASGIGSQIKVVS